MNIDHIDIRTIAPALGVGTNSEPDYLDFDIRGRGYFEQLFFNSGVSYLVGMGAGGAYGAAAGYRSAPSSAMRVKMNSLLNGLGKTGANAGNGLGAAALLYTTFECWANMLKIEDTLGGNPIINPVAAGIATGMTYKCTAGPRAVVLAGVIGGCGAAAMNYFPNLWR
ncbi:hypothetical protein M885DRAFT_520864 [Pelagophyceae sp. CCMP2097]|nr:hypothetical protein M885DRAFT_520864 [Pelagophyceae sp. CCMP2097]|mmetsp:Transcript_8654/g.28495  ORF Transcript_8654/g.28495 Transcript_8654/m.28495 type:complete len:167 (+) Transcript_8654:65-565(+)